MVAARERAHWTGRVQISLKAMVLVKGCVFYRWQKENQVRLKVPRLHLLPEGCGSSAQQFTRKLATARRLGQNRPPVPVSPPCRPVSMEGRSVSDRKGRGTEGECEPSLEPSAAALQSHPLSFHSPKPSFTLHSEPAQDTERVITHRR